MNLESEDEDVCRVEVVVVVAAVIVVVVVVERSSRMSSRREGGKEKGGGGGKGKEMLEARQATWTILSPSLSLTEMNPHLVSSRTSLLSLCVFF